MEFVEFVRGMFELALRFKKTDKNIFLLALMLNWNSITGLIDSMSKIPVLAFLSFFSSITVVFSLLFLVLTVMLTVKNSNNAEAYGVLIGWGFLFVISLFLNPQLLSVVPRAFIYFANNVFCLAVLLRSVADMQALINTLRSYIPISIIYAALQWVVGINGQFYSMAFSYATMIPMLLCLLQFVMKKKGRLWYFLAFLFFSATNFKYGSRGCFVCCALELLFIFCLSEKKKQAKYVFGFIGIVLGVLLSWQKIFGLLARYFSESRNFIILSQNIVFYGSGREKMYRIVLNEFFSNPFAIRGLYSDRIILSGYQNNLETLWGSYAHNVVFELLYQFGIWCTPIIVFVAVYMISILIKGRNACHGDQCIVLLAYSFAIGQLMISSSYLIAPSSGLLLGVLLWSKRHHKAETLTESIPIGDSIYESENSYS